MVKIPPRFGYLEIDPPLSREDAIVKPAHFKPYDSQEGLNAASPFQVSLFDQSVINEGRLHYIQSISNQSSDSFVFDVTNGISQLDGLIFHFTVIPRNIYIESRELSVTEGKSTILLPTHLHVITSYYENRIEDYLVVENPAFGKLTSLKSKRNQKLNNKTLTMFSLKDLEKKVIQVR